jgi:diguanylate cyclase (GGDEF)-like protein
MLRQMLTTDNLTGASNRAHFFEVAERERSRAIRYHQPLSLITLDIDHFKLVNDTYGHAGGDEALKAVSLACLNLLRPSEVFARIGGEEFVVLLPGIDLAEAAERAEQLRSSVAATCVELNGPDLHCTISLGCSTLSSQDNSVSAMLAAADVALYEAKRKGRNRVVLSGDPTAIA